MLKRVREFGGLVDSQINKMPWGERLFYAKDPFGNPISFVDQNSVFRGAAADSKRHDAET